MTAQRESVYSLLPAHPKHIYPDWKINERSLDSYETGYYENQLIDEYGGTGLLTSYCPRDSMPDAAEQFLREQFGRFGIDQPPQSLLYYCWWQTYYYVDTMDPYVFFYGCCDVIKTEENYFFQYSVCNDDFREWTEIVPGEGETFRYWDKGIQAWETLMQYPGLDEFFDGFADYYEDYFLCLTEDNTYPGIETEEKEFFDLWGKKGSYDRIHLGLWASIMWMMSPMGKSWRVKRHPIFDICYEHGEVLVHQWCFYSPQYFRVDDRPAMTCSVCGNSEWCVELTQVGPEDTKYICESCLNPIVRAGATCGNRVCTKISCPHNPGVDAAKSIAADARYGSVRKLENGHKVRELPGMMYLNEKAINHYSTGIADIMGEDLKKLLTF